MRSFFILPALASIAFAQITPEATPYEATESAAETVAETVTTPSVPVKTTIPENPPDALDFKGLREIPEPVTAEEVEIPGLEEFDVPYDLPTAIESVIAEQTESPLSVFPVATVLPDASDIAAVAINAGGNDALVKREHAHAKRELAPRAACDPQATIPNVYNVDVSSYSKFKNDATIASVASSATAPLGYFEAFKNLKGANSAYAYLGYSVVKTYDVNACAKKCTAKAGCLSFNIYFERDPVLEPGKACPNPDAFANIKCSFWGSKLDDTTATNLGQYREDFRVAIAGSNSYTTTAIYSVPGTSEPLYLNDAAMNAPLRDCQGTWTYLGYKLFTGGPFNPNLCKVACDKQTEYNLQWPPAEGVTPLCAGFGTYLLTKSNATGVYPQGQMCTMYTSNWDAQYAVNKAQWDDAPGGGKFTFSYSFFYSIPSLQPTCPPPATIPRA